jgi:hypothetical protein
LPDWFEVTPDWTLEVQRVARTDSAVVMLLLAPISLKCEDSFAAVTAEAVSPLKSNVIESAAATAKSDYFEPNWHSATRIISFAFIQAEIASLS